MYAFLYNTTTQQIGLCNRWMIQDRIISLTPNCTFLTALLLNTPHWEGQQAREASLFISLFALKTSAAAPMFVLYNKCCVHSSQDPTKKFNQPANLDHNIYNKPFFLQGIYYFEIC